MFVGNTFARAKEAEILRQRPGSVLLGYAAGHFVAKALQAFEVPLDQVGRHFVIVVHEEDVVTGGRRRVRVAE